MLCLVRLGERIRGCHDTQMDTLAEMERKMKTYQITLTEVRKVNVVIEAENEVEAEDFVISQHEDGEWEPYFSVSTEMKIEEQSESTEDESKGVNTV